MKETLYETILDSIKEWCNNREENTHVQFIIGTLERVKFDFYHQNYGTVFTTNTIIKALEGSKVEFGKDSSIVVDRTNNED